MQSSETATILPRACAGETQQNTSSVACARAVVLHVYLYDSQWLEYIRSRTIIGGSS